jgi:hypothetical protein
MGVSIVKIKVSEAIGAQLDQSVVIALGYTIDEDGCAVKDGIAEFNVDCFSPSEVWMQGGPIIEREKMSVCPALNAPWMAVCGNAEHRKEGPTPLIAAMRCYVASKLGAEVEVPDELVPEPQIKLNTKAAWPFR